MVDTHMDEGMVAHVNVVDTNIIELTLGGNLSSDEHAEELRNWTQAVTETITTLSMHGGVRYCIATIHPRTQFDEGTISIIRDLARSHEVLNIKTAVVGGTLFSNMAIRTIIVLAQRKNVRIFENKEAALVWLEGEKI